MESFVSQHLARSADAAVALAADRTAGAVLASMAARIALSLRAGGKLLIAGNGGSAADAQHLAAEFVSRLMFDRAPLAAIALSESGPILTACGNDYGFQTIFARQLQALGRAGDVFLGLSTSGNSPNILAALDTAKAGGLARLGFAGGGGGAMTENCDLLLQVPAANGQIVQQLHVTAGHALLGAIEHAMFDEGQPA